MNQVEKKPIIPLRVLVVEDSENDTMLLLREIRKGGYQLEFVRVETRDTFRRELAEQQWDLIVSDFSMPDFDGVSALNILKESGQDIPFILVSGTITEETAVSSMKAGAHDFISKFNMARLVPAIGRELKDAQNRREGRRMKKELEAYHAGLEKTVEERTRDLKAAHNKLQKSKELGDALNRIGELIHSTLDVDKIMRQVLIEAAQATGVDASSIGLLQDGNVFLQYVHNLPEEFTHATLPLNKVRGVGYAIRTRDAVAFNDAQNDDRVNASFWKEHGVKSLMAVPLISRNEVIGAFTFYCIETHIAFEGIHLDFARKLSAHVALALENSRLYNETREAQERASFLAGAIEDSSLPFAAAYPDARLINFNRACADLTGYKPAELRAMTWTALTPPEWHEHEAQQLRELNRTGVPQLYQKECIRKDGSRVPIEIKVHLVRDQQGKPHYYYAFVSDITIRKKVEEALRESEKHFREVFMHAPVGMLLTDARGQYQYSNRAFLNIMGYAEQEMYPAFDLRTLSYPDDLPATVDGIEKLLAGEIPAFFQEKRYIRKDGSVVWVAVSSSVRRNADGTPFQIVGLFEDINDRKRMEEKIRHMAHHDALTGLPNRHLFTDILRVEIAQARRHNKKLGILFLDLDRFKEINDSLGHHIGDYLLKEVATRFRQTIRDSDSVGRIGGDEFNIVLADINRTDDVIAIVKKVIESLRKPITIDGNELTITTSIGISVYPDDSEENETLLRYADMAMYSAKEGGRNAYRFYNPELNIRSRDRMRFEQHLRHALQRGGLSILYQPQIHIKTGKMISAEALIRWRHPELGLLEPSRFIPFAEENGLIEQIDEWVLRSVCKQGRAWIDAGLPPLSLTVNLSARQFQNLELVHTVSNILEKTGMPAEALDIEITESTAMNNIERSVTHLRKLAHMGVHVSIDDFGSGYSSLNYLKRLPVDKLKIDKSFIQDIATDPDDRSIIHAVTAMAHSLKMKVLAEGVETEDQLSFLREIDCDEAQGFFFSKPISAEELREMASTG